MVSNLIIACVWLLSLGLIFASYKIAGQVWVDRHALKFKYRGKDEEISGAWGEAALITLACLTLFWVERYTPDWSLAGALTRWPVLTLILLIIVIIVLVLYTRSVPKAARADGEDERTVQTLTKTYRVYSIYSGLLFFGAFILLALLTYQFFSDFSAFNAKKELILSQLDSAKDLPADPAMRVIEGSFIDALSLLNTTQKQMTPTFVFVLALFVFNFLILATPVHDLFRNDARVITHITTVLAILLVIILGGFIYIALYAQFVGDYLDSLLELRDVTANGGWQMQARYGEILLIAQDKRSLIGFITEMSNEWGGLVAVFGIAQWVIDRLTDPLRKKNII